MISRQNFGILVIFYGRKIVHLALAETVTITIVVTA